MGSLTSTSILTNEKKKKGDIKPSSGSRGGARGTRPPYFYTKLRAEGPKNFFGTPAPPPPPLISRSGSGTEANGLTSPPIYPIICGKVSNHCQHDYTSFLKTLVIGLAKVPIHDLPLGRPVLSQLSQPDGGI